MEKRKVDMNDSYYQTPEQSWWTGRMDGTAPQQKRWWQTVKLTTPDALPTDLRNAFVLLGFACDEGVKRNLGRAGAVEGPAVIRGACQSLPDYFSPSQQLYDAGNFLCPNQNLEEAQAQLSSAVSKILKNNGFPVLLGGGHEILYAHYRGVRKYFPNKKIGIVNFDAHFDLRQPDNRGASSGTGFYQVAEDCRANHHEFSYLALGIQQSGNTRELFNSAHRLKVQYTLAEELNWFSQKKIQEALQSFLKKTDLVCLTIDMDVFSASIAPGVSAPTAGGILYDTVFRDIMQLLTSSKKLISLDIAEVNPAYDIDGHTAKLAAQILFQVIGLS